ncbi:MAG: LptF/LptG family permease [Armatimonadetes bacterium]|nr:LptF/LptG family permease [Armatimonadota bacterium]
MKLLDRYISRELIWPFLVGVAAFTAILMGTNMLFQLAKMAANGVPVATVIRLFMLGLPALVVLTFPMAMLFSSLMAFARLSGESELIAMYASGINLYRIMIPIFLLSFGVAALTWGFNEEVVPWSSRSAADLKNVINQAPAQSRITLPQFVENKLVRLVVANEFDPAKGMLKGVFFISFKEGVPAFDVSAPEATFDEEKGEWAFRNSTIRVARPEGTVVNKTRVAYYNIGKKPEEIQRSKIKPEQMTYVELTEYIRERRRQGLPTGENEVDLQRKVALPFTSLVFAAIGAPLGIRPSRRASGFGVGLGLSIIVIFIFYVLTSYLSVLGGQGILDPALAAWLPNLITLALGIVLLIRAPK